jgi:hypothetical protein
MKHFTHPFAGKNYAASDIIPVLAIVGIIGVAMLGINFKFGLVVLGLAVGILLATIRNTRLKQTTPPEYVRHEPTIKTIFSELELTERPATWPAQFPPRPEPQGVPVKAVDLKLAQPLLTTLSITGHNLNAPVVFLGEGTAAITAQDVIVEIAKIMREKNDDFGQMVRIIPDMYEMLWDYAGEATQKYGDLNLIRVHIASSVYFKVTAGQPKL